MNLDWPSYLSPDHFIRNLGDLRAPPSTPSGPRYNFTSSPSTPDGVSLTKPTAMRACEGCRKRKIKCDGAKTKSWPCAVCRRLKLTCIPPTVNHNSSHVDLPPSTPELNRVFESDDTSGSSGDKALVPPFQSWHWSQSEMSTSYVRDLSNPSDVPPSDAASQKIKHLVSCQCSQCHEPHRFVEPNVLASENRLVPSFFPEALMHKSVPNWHKRHHSEAKAFIRNSEPPQRVMNKRYPEAKRFTCGGELTAGGAWGCGRRFARADKLADHFRYGAGRICVKPLIDEKSVELESESKVQKIDQIYVFGQIKTASMTYTITSPAITGTSVKAKFGISLALLRQHRALRGSLPGLNLHSLPELILFQAHRESANSPMLELDWNNVDFDYSQLGAFQPLGSPNLPRSLSQNVQGAPSGTMLPPSSPKAKQKLLLRHSQDHYLLVDRDSSFLATPWCTAFEVLQKDGTWSYIDIHQHNAKFRDAECWLPEYIAHMILLRQVESLLASSSKQASLIELSIRHSLEGNKSPEYSKTTVWQTPITNGQDTSVRVGKSSDQMDQTAKSVSIPPCGMSVASAPREPSPVIQNSSSLEGSGDEQSEQSTTSSLEQCCNDSSVETLYDLGTIAGPNASVPVSLLLRAYVKHINSDQGGTSTSKNTSKEGCRPTSSNGKNDKTNKTADRSTNPRKRKRH